MRSRSPALLAVLTLALALPLTPETLVDDPAVPGGIVHAVSLGNAPAPSAIILDYHTFLDSGNSSIDFSLTELAAQLDAMAALGYRFVSLDDAIAGRIEGKANIVVTIDDGNHSVYAACKEVFEPRGIKPVLFVYPAIILGHVKYALTPARLQELAADGCIVGAHGYNHNPVTDKAWSKGEKAFNNEIRLPGPAIARILGAAPAYFAYPFGVYSARAEADLAAAGYAWAFSADDSVIPVDFTDAGLDHMAVHRTIVYRWNGKRLLKYLADYLKG
jgi:peptidoglycan/xylan/chitin deacetylase (PgdA/CDA1 family)